jgi:hypothetical protein
VMMGLHGQHDTTATSSEQRATSGFVHTMAPGSRGSVI